jgi:hypothetical protein
MRISCCTRCDQLIEYEAPFEGEEVLCPSCDNITRLQEIPEDELPPIEPGEADAVSDSDEPRKSRAPMRISAEELPKPNTDPVAPVAPVNADGERGPDKVRKEAAADNSRKPKKTKQPEERTKSKPSHSKPKGSVSADKIPANMVPEIRIVEGVDAVTFFGGNDGGQNTRRNGLRVPQGLAIAIVCVLVATVLAIKYWPSEAAKQEKDRMTTLDLRAEIERQAAARRVSSAPPVPPPPQPVPIIPSTPAGRALANEPLIPIMTQGGTTNPLTGTVAVEFPKLPTTIRRNVAEFEDEAFLTYIESALSLPYRLFGETVTDLRILGFAMKRGMTEFEKGWHLVGGLVVEKSDKGLLLRLDRRYFPAGGVVFINRFPTGAAVRRNQALGIMAKTSGSRELVLESGEKQIVAVYEFGLMPSKKMIEVVDMKAKTREKLNRQAIAVISQKKADAKQAETERKKQATDLRAVEYLRKRVKQGSASAQYSLALRYLDGAGVPKNQGEGLRLLKAAAKQNHYMSKRKLKELGK